MTSGALGFFLCGAMRADRRVWKHPNLHFSRMLALFTLEGTCRFDPPLRTSHKQQPGARRWLGDVQTPRVGRQLGRQDYMIVPLIISLCLSGIGRLLSSSARCAAFSACRVCPFFVQYGQTGQRCHAALAGQNRRLERLFALAGGEPMGHSVGVAH